MVDIEAGGAKKIDNYQHFSKAFRFANYGSLMASMKPNAARLKTAQEFKKAEFTGEFGESALRAVLFALYEQRACPPVRSGLFCLWPSVR